MSEYIIGRFIGVCICKKNVFTKWDCMNFIWSWIFERSMLKGLLLKDIFVWKTVSLIVWSLCGNTFCDTVKTMYRYVCVRERLTVFFHLWHRCVLLFMQHFFLFLLWHSCQTSVPSLVTKRPLSPGAQQLFFWCGPWGHITIHVCLCKGQNCRTCWGDKSFNSDNNYMSRFYGTQSDLNFYFMSIKNTKYQ